MWTAAVLAIVPPNTGEDSMTQLILLGIVAAVILYGIYIYNQLVKNRQMVK